MIESVRLAKSLGYNVVSKWYDHERIEWAYRRFEIRFPDEWIGYPNSTLEEAREYKDIRRRGRVHYWGIPEPKKKDFPGRRDYKSCV